MVDKWMSVFSGDQMSLVVVCVAGFATAAAIAVSTSRRWSGSGSGKQGKGSYRKGLARSPGISIVRVKSDAGNASGDSNGGSAGWGLGSVLGTGGGTDSATKWEKSKQKGEMGYYFAHHTSMKELAPEDYRMNGPRLLSKGPITSQENKAADAPPTAVAAAASPPMPRRRAQMISSYSWEDYGEEVRLTFRQSGWDWTKVDEEEIRAEWGPRRFRLFIDSREYGLHTMDLPRLSGDVADVKVLKLRSKLVAALVKGGRGSYSKKAPWTELQSKPPTVTAVKND